jgi:hypothetical protein
VRTDTQRARAGGMDRALRLRSTEEKAACETGSRDCILPMSEHYSIKIRGIWDFFSQSFLEIGMSATNSTELWLISTF